MSFRKVSTFVYLLFYQKCTNFICSSLIWSLLDSPGVPPSANAHELFKGFSFVAPSLTIEGETDVDTGLFKNGFSSVTSKLQSIGIYSKCKGRSLNEYDFLRVLGKGSFSVCQMCLHKESGQKYAVKVS